MPVVTLRISRKWARMLQMLGKDVANSENIENILEYLLTQIDFGVFMPGSDLRPVVRKLFDDESSSAPTWEAALVPDSRFTVQTSQGPAFAGLRFDPRYLFVDVSDQAPDSIIVYRLMDPDDGHGLFEDVKTKHDMELDQRTEDNLTRARLENGRKIVYQLHVDPVLAGWFLADRRAEKRGESSPQIPETALRHWAMIRKHHAIPDSIDGYEVMHSGLPETPDRDLRGDPSWR